LSSSTPIAVIDVIVVINGFKIDSRHHIYAISIALIAIAFTVIAVIFPLLINITIQHTPLPSLLLSPWSFP
jgi:hypothetical protein